MGLLSILHLLQFLIELLLPAVSLWGFWVRLIYKLVLCLRVLPLLKFWLRKISLFLLKLLRGHNMTISQMRIFYIKIRNLLFGFLPLLPLLCPL
jgi:hypothetical protein